MGEELKLIDTYALVSELILIFIVSYFFTSLFLSTIMMAFLATMLVKAPLWMKHCWFNQKHLGEID